MSDEGADQPSAAALIEDWVTIWQSELAALLVDRELQEGAQALVDGWATQMRRQMQLWGPAFDGAARSAGAIPTPRPAPAAAAPDGRDAVIRDLLARVAELERRIAGPGADPGDRGL